MLENTAPSSSYASRPQSQDGRVTELLSAFENMVIITFQFVLLLFQIGSSWTVKLQVG